MPVGGDAQEDGAHSTQRRCPTRSIPLPAADSPARRAPRRPAHQRCAGCPGSDASRKRLVDRPWDAARYRGFIHDFATRTGGISKARPCWFLENHDLPRVASTFDQAGLGQLGPVPSSSCFTRCAGRHSCIRDRNSDCRTRTSRPSGRSTSTGATPSAPRSPGNGGRKPGQGRDSPKGQPWLPLVDDAEALCVQSQETDPRSTLHLVRRIAALRSRTPRCRTVRSEPSTPGPTSWPGSGRLPTRGPRYGQLRRAVPLAGPPTRTAHRGYDHARDGPRPCRRGPRLGHADRPSRPHPRPRRGPTDPTLTGPMSDLAAVGDARPCR